jgi:hypothetical protein
MERWGKSVRVFVNGVDVTRDDHVGSDAFPNDAPLALGANVGGGDFSRGALADFRLYTGKLRPAQIAALAAAAPPTR